MEAYGNTIEECQILHFYNWKSCLKLINQETAIYVYYLEMEKVRCTHIHKSLKEFEGANSAMGKGGIGKCCFL